jgi:hypothetical protein
MGVIINPGSELGKELTKWEQFPRHTVDGEIIPPGNPYTYRPFPKMLYKAVKGDDGRIRCLDTLAPISLFPTMDAYQRESLRVDAFNASCMMQVGSTDEMERAKRQGWVEGGPDKAIAALKALEDDISTAAAEANAKALGMTAKAKRERAAREAATDEHIPE